MRTLKSYEDWKHCITQLCGIPLTGPYVEQRLTALRDLANETTQKFVAMWGEPHRLCVIGWFEQAQREMGGREMGGQETGGQETGGQEAVGTHTDPPPSGRAQ